MEEILITRAPPRLGPSTQIFDELLDKTGVNVRNMVLR